MSRDRKIQLMLTLNKRNILCLRRFRKSLFLKLPQCSKALNSENKVRKCRKNKKCLKHRGLKVLELFLQLVRRKLEVLFSPLHLFMDPLLFNKGLLHLQYSKHLPLEQYLKHKLLLSLGHLCSSLKYLPEAFQFQALQHPLEGDLVTMVLTSIALNHHWLHLKDHII